MAQADLTGIGDRAGDAEGLETLADGGGGLAGALGIFLQGDGAAEGVGPAGVFKGDGLDALDDGGGVYPAGEAVVAGFLDGREAVFGQEGVDLIDSSFVTFKQSHFAFPLIRFSDR